MYLFLQIMRARSNVQRNMEDEVKRATKFYGLDEKNAKKEIKRINKLRANHYKYYTDQEWGMASNYDLCLNSGLIGIEGCVKAIQQVLELTE